MILDEVRTDVKQLVIHSAEQEAPQRKSGIAVGDVGENWAMMEITNISMLVTFGAKNSMY